MEEFTFYYFDKASRGNRITGRKVRVHNKPGNRTIAFSSDCTSEIVAIPNPKMGFRKDNLTGDLFILISSDKGIEVKANNRNCKAPSPIVYSKAIVDFMVQELHLTDIASDVEISENLANRPDIAIYKILTK